MHQDGRLDTDDIVVPVAHRLLSAIAHFALPLGVERTVVVRGTRPPVNLGRLIAESTLYAKRNHFFKYAAHGHDHIDYRIKKMAPQPGNACLNE